jgi:hypothetical protein
VVAFLLHKIINVINLSVHVVQRSRRREGHHAADLALLPRQRHARTRRSGQNGVPEGEGASIQRAAFKSGTDVMLFKIISPEKLAFFAQLLLIFAKI